MAAVRIGTDGKVIHSDRKVKLSKKQKDEVHFSSQANSGPWHVIFPAGPAPYVGSPFGKDSFVVPKVGNVASGEVVVPPGTTEYKYEVRDSEGNLTDDPDVLIDT